MINKGPKRAFVKRRKNLLLACFVFCFFHATSAQAADDVVVHITDNSFFDGWRLHLPAQATVTRVGKITIEGQLIGFVGDYLPLFMGEREIRISDGRRDLLESFFLTLRVDRTGVKVAKKRLRSNTREIVSWKDPKIIKVQGGNGTYFSIVLTTPVLRDIDGVDVLAAMAGPTAHFGLNIKSTPPGSEIYLNSEKQDYPTNTNLSVVYMKGETEKRWLIRNRGLVNCYGAIRLPTRAATVDCIHRDVR
jgi:hypothetical protein